MKWKGKPRRKPDKEQFIGSLRANLTPEVEDFLKPMIPTKTVFRDGMRIQYFEDGRIEIESVFSVLSQMVKEIKARDNGYSKR